ncbi:MAG: tRNA pseudouridine(38-40) synthase TruA [Candidatus Margulisbacteria bacterium]|nr:tRNA pseudouridine(38-40) synthase TruA [Candidatus Margulisiibacteriota bacterium]MBU1022078.1 tRNA pseudouridine(38-40) synthase TruA [Candidatus Margulisiibacteriota bacterium]MBU1729673.1 tRNA pseudouridine(38-40) synthase TruA [Candidatus Margulisiibacteriota bacterium]MBU1954993.1 tRNA pseudouridine(38-40) synthase TruA [Candidatus Margulisiibacteriota bacterium]
MRNFKFKVSYFGLPFYGFGIQKDVVTVQGELEKAIKKVTAQKVRVHPAGRTDAGVHAAGQIISFRLQTKLSPDKLKSALNAHLDDGIRIISGEEVNDQFHARYSAKNRIYVYNLLVGEECPFYLDAYVWHLRSKLDYKAMQRAAKLLIGRHDFSSFSIKEKDKNLVRLMQKITFRERRVESYLGNNDVLKVKLISITFKANAYARGMIRGIVGSLVAVGQKKISVPKFNEIFRAKDRTQAGKGAPGKGLSLVQVDY